MARRRRNQARKYMYCGFVPIAVAIISAAAGIATPHLNRHEYTATIVDKKPYPNSKGDEYLIYTTLPDGTERAFEDANSSLEGKSNSTEIYDKLEIGKTYRLKTYSFRVKSFDSYENIIKFEQVSKDSIESLTK